MQAQDLTQLAGRDEVSVAGFLVRKAAQGRLPHVGDFGISLYRRLLHLEFQNRLCDDDGVIEAGGPSPTARLDGIEVSGGK